MIEFYKQNLKGLSNQELALVGRELAENFCIHNGIKVPEISIRPNFGQKYCGRYEGNAVITIYPQNCAKIAFEPGNRKWSYPGYKVDREPIGVVAHELGHYIDDKLKLYRGFPKYIEAITSYEPDVYESVAESMKVFITNPDLLRIIAPNRYAFILSKGLKPLITDAWDVVLTSVPHINVIKKHFSI